ncbi:MAG: DUF4175 family protein, partial [bacterium]
VPRLKYAYAKGDWQETAMDQQQKNLFTHNFDSVREPLRYSIRYRDISTPVYAIKIHRVPQVGDIVLKYTFPVYTGQPPISDKNTSGDIEAILGTRIDIEAQANVSLSRASLVTDDGKNLPVTVTKGTELKVSLVLTGEKQYWFKVEDQEGYLNIDPVKYNIVTLKDEFPEVQVLFPATDLTVSETGEVKIVCRVTDDFGVSQLELVYKKASDPSLSRLTIQTFRQLPQDKVVEYNWLLRQLNLAPGDMISYYLEVQDNDVVSGPKKSVSPTYYLEIFSYEKEHQAIEALQDLAHEGLMKLLEDQMTAKSDLDKLENNLPPDKIAPLKVKQEDISRRAEDLNEMLDKMLTRMNNDPLTNYRVYSEYHNLNQNLKNLKDGKMAEATQTFDQLSQATNREKINSLAREKKLQEDIISELEKMALLAEDTNQYQKMEDVLNKAYEMEDLANDFNNLLEEYKNKPDSEKMKQLKKALDKLAKMMSELQKAMTQVSKELPEEFVNQPDVKEINFSKMESLRKQLEEALKAGNLDEALNQALELAKEMAKMMSTMRSAAGKAGGAGQFSYLSGEADELTREIEKLTKEEQGLIDETAELDKKRLQALLKVQEKLLKELAVKQKQLLQQAQNLQPQIRQRLTFDSQLYILAINNLRQVLPKMDKIYQELNSLAVHDSLTLLKECLYIFGQTGDYLTEANKIITQNIAQLQIQQKNQKQPDPDNIKQFQKLTGQKEDIDNIFNNMEVIKAGEEDILNALKPKEEDLESIFSQQDKDKLKDLSNRQKDNRLNTEKLQQKLDALSRKTSLVGPEIQDSLNKAGQAMGEAENHLSSQKTAPALDKEQEALYNLSQSKEDLQAAAQALAEMEQKMSQPMASFLRQRGGPRGRLGTDTGFVKIPAPEDYQVPQDFRKEIMEGLKEKYPKIYDKLIKEYYKKLVE